MEVMGRTYSVRAEQRFETRFYSHGGLDQSGWCNTGGAPFSSGGKIYDKAYEETYLSISISIRMGRISTSNQHQVYFDNVAARYEQGHLHDSLLGSIYWSPNPVHCDQSRILVFCGVGKLYLAQNSANLVGGQALLTYSKEETDQIGAFLLQSLARPCTEDEDEGEVAASDLKRVITPMEADEVAPILASNPLHLRPTHNSKMTRNPLTERNSSAAYYRTHVKGITVHVDFRPESLSRGCGGQKGGSLPVQGSVLPSAAIRAAIRDMEVTVHYQLIRQSLSSNARFNGLWTSLCEVERSRIRGQLLEIASGNGMALTHDLGQGHVVLNMGMTGLVIKGIPKEATLASYVNCTEEIAVRLINATNEDGSPDNKIYFADGQTKVLQPFANIIECDPQVPRRFKISNEWYCGYTPRLRICPAPTSLRPGVDVLESSQSALAHMGKHFYREEQLQAFSQLMIHGKRIREAYMTEAVRAAYHNMQSNRDLLELPESTLDHITTMVHRSLFPFAWYLGEWFIWVAGFSTLFAGISWLLDIFCTLTIGLALYGCGWWLAAALFSNIFSLVTDEK